MLAIRIKEAGFNPLKLNTGENFVVESSKDLWGLEIPGVMTKGKKASKYNWQLWSADTYYSSALLLI